MQHNDNKQLNATMDEVRKILKKLTKGYDSDTAADRKNAAH